MVSNAKWWHSVACFFSRRRRGKYYASASKFNCESVSRLEVSVTVREPTPRPTGAANSTLCKESRIADLVVFGENIQWYASNVSQTPLYDGSMLVSGSHYFATQTLNGFRNGAIAEQNFDTYLMLHITSALTKLKPTFSTAMPVPTVRASRASLL